TATAKQPLLVVMKPNSTQSPVKFRTADATRKWKYDFDYTFTWGAPYVKQDPKIVYALPYPVQSRFVITQGAGGATSHTGSNQNAIDFGLPLRSPVTAARPGLVVLTLDGFTEGKNDADYKDKANLI